MDVLHSLSQFYKGTLRSVIWIDSLSKNPCSWKFSKDASPDPFVLMAWLCSNFEELILYGYKYSGENLIAIGRLRGSEMKKLEIPEADILYNQVVDNVYLTKVCIFPYVYIYVYCYIKFKPKLKLHYLITYFFILKF